VAGERRFRTSFMGGFKKSDVNAYIERMLKEFDEKLKSKDDEIAVIRNQNRDLKIKYEELQRKADEIEETRRKLADVLLQAREDAERIREEARNEAAEEKKRLEEANEREKEKLVDIRRDIKNLKDEIVKVLSRYTQELTAIAGDDADEGTEEGASDTAHQEAATASEQGSGSDYWTGYQDNTWNG